jgi:hypothetical protein
MIPVAVAVGALVGGLVTVFLTEGDKKELREQIVRQDESIERLKAQSLRAADREVQQRREIVRLTLEWSKSRLTTLMESPSTPLDQLERVWAVGKTLEMISNSLPADGRLASDEQVFVQLITKAQRGEKLTRVERAQVEDFLDAKLGDRRRDFLEEKLAQQYKSLLARRQDRQREREVAEHRAGVLARLARTGGPEAPSEQGIVASRARQAAQDIASITEELDRIERVLVVVARVSRPEDAQSEDDRVARDIVQRLAAGRTLTDEEDAFLRYYRQRYFGESRKLLEKRRGINIALQAEAG